MSKLNDIERLEVIGELSKGTSGGKLAKRYGVSRDAIKYIKDKNKDAILRKQTDLLKLKEDILNLALHKLYGLLSNDKQQAVELIRIIQELNNQIRLDNEKPTSITKRDSYSNLSPEQIEDKIKELFVEYKSLKSKNNKSVVNVL